MLVKKKKSQRSRCEHSLINYSTKWYSYCKDWKYWLTSVANKSTWNNDFKFNYKILNVIQVVDWISDVVFMIEIFSFDQIIWFISNTRLFSRRFISYNETSMSIYSLIIEEKSLIFLSYESESNITDFNCAINIIKCILMIKSN